VPRLGPYSDKFTVCCEQCASLISAFKDEQGFLEDWNMWGLELE